MKSPSVAALGRRHTRSSPSSSYKRSGSSSARRHSLLGPSPLSKSSRSLKRQGSSNHSPPAEAKSEDATYAPLCEDVQYSPLASHLQLSNTVDGTSVVDEILRDLLKDNAKITGDLGATIDYRLQDKVLLLDNPISQGGAAEKARLKVKQRRAKRSTVHMSYRQHRKLGSFQIPEQYHKYALYKPLQDMWKKYAASLLAHCGESMELIQSALLSADLHGAILAVVESKKGSVVGTQGIMIRETENTFSILTSQDKLRVIAKQGTIFMFQLEDLRVTLFGNSLTSRSLKDTSSVVAKAATIEL